MLPQDTDNNPFMIGQMITKIQSVAVRRIIKIIATNAVPAKKEAITMIAIHIETKMMNLMIMKKTKMIIVNVNAKITTSDVIATIMMIALMITTTIEIKTLMTKILKQQSEK